MKRHIVLLIVLTSLGGLSTSFITKNNTPTGTFTGGEINGKTIVELNLSEDHTFKYKDHSVKSKLVGVTGTWSLKNNRIHLKSNTNSPRFHNTWKLNKEGNCIKSRKGLTYYRLCK